MRSLEVELRCNLYHPRIAGASRRAQQGIAAAVTGLKKFGRVKGIEHFPAQLELLFLRNREPFEHRGVEVFNAGSKQEIVAERL